MICRTDDARDLPLPGYQTEHAAGLDLYANVHENITLPPGGYALVPTGIRIALPDGYEAQIRPRSGLALRCGITMLNSPGTVDADYRGEISVIPINLGKKDFVIRRGMRIAQMVINRTERVCFTETVIRDDTARGSGGFGHTGGLNEEE